MRRKDYPTIEENVQSLIRMYGAQTFLKYFTPEEIIQNLTVEQREQLIQKLIQILIDEIGTEQCKQLIRRLAKTKEK